MSIYIAYGILSDSIINPLLTTAVDSVFTGFRIFTIVEHILVASFFYQIIGNVRARKLILSFSMLFLLYSIFDFISSGTKTFDSIPVAISSLILIIYAIYYLFEEIQTPNSFFLYSTPTFWAVVGIIFSFSGTFFVFIFSQKNYSNPDFKSTYSLIVSSFSIIRNIFLIVALIIKPPKTQPKKKPAPNL